MSESIFSDPGVSYEFYKIFKNTFFIEYPRWLLLKLRDWARVNTNYLFLGVTGLKIPIRSLLTSKKAQKDRSFSFWTVYSNAIRIYRTECQFQIPRSPVV